MYIEKNSKMVIFLYVISVLFFSILIAYWLDFSFGVAGIKFGLVLLKVYI